MGWFIVVELPIPDVAPLKRLAVWLREHHAGMVRYNVCTGLHLDSAAMRGVLGFINTLVPPPIPQGSFATPRQTEAWVTAQLEAAGLSPVSVAGPA